MSSIPETVTHDEYLEAIEPLLNLLGVNGFEIFQGIHIGPGERGDDLAAIHFNLVARAEDDESDNPQGVADVDGLAPAPNETAELAWPVTVRVVV